MDLNFKDEKIDKFYQLIEKFGSNEFRSPYRSTIPLLLLFKERQINDFGLIENTDKTEPKYIFEFETPVRKGKGLPSCTDLMIAHP